MQITKKMEHVNDQRRQYVLDSTGNFFGLKIIEESSFKNEQAILNFLNDGSCFTLCACSYPEASSGGQTIIFDNKILSSNAEQVLVFFKVCPDIVTTENIHSIIFVSSIQGSPIQSLYHSIRRVYIPALLHNGTQTAVDPQLHELISQLESGLKTAIHSGAEVSSGLAGIFSVTDECQYWKSIIKTSKSKREKDQALVIYNLLKPLEKEIFSLQGSKALLEMEDMLEMAHGTLDELWHVEETSYPQTRMEHLMQIIGNTLTKVIQDCLQNINIWNEDFLSIEKTLKQSVSASLKWLDSCKKLTSIFWSNLSNHQWKGSVCEPAYLKKFVLRLQEILRIRTLHYQLTMLLTPEERQEIKMDKALLHFSVVNATQCSPYTEGDWKAAVIDFEKIVEPIEEKVSSRLQAKIQQENLHPLQVLQEMQKQGALISRPNMLRLLTGQRETLLASLSTVIKDSQTELNSRQGLQSSSVTENVVWARQLESKLADIQTAGKLLLEDLTGYSKHQQMTETLVHDLQEFRTDIVDTWTQEISAALSNRSLGLKMDAPVVHFESGHQLMKVNYDPKLVALIREARQLTVLGHKIPSPIKNATELAKKFMKQAKALEKVATFHNTIGDRMVPSQRPMMLEAALALAQLVQQESQVTWSDIRAVDLYLSKLQAAVERLAKQNNLLATHHAKIRIKVLALMNTDLLRSQGQWKDGVREIRDIFMQVESQKFSNMRAWRAHWDRQLYKALEFQYQVGLEALSEHLPEMKIELVFRQQQLQFQPPMEEIRSKYYGQLKKFLSIPNLFRGVGDGKENLIFPTIIERNAHRFGPLFACAEELFGKLDALKFRFMRWVALGSVDLDVMAQKHLNVATDWDTNFRASKAWGQEIARLTCLEEKIECFTISYLPVRAEAEVHNRRYWDVLAGSLQASIARDAVDIERFAKEGMETLRQQPQTAEEIGIASIKHAQLTKEIPDMLTKYETVLKKNKTLASWTKERVDALDKIADVWENFQTALGNHDSLISRQVESIKAGLETCKEELIGQTEKFWLRWQQLRPSESKLQEGGSEVLQAVLISLAERRAEWNTLQQARDKLSEEYQQFGLSPVDITNWEDMEKDLKSHEATWSLFNDFQTGINDISTEEWIIFRSKSFKFEEFLLHWDQKLQNSDSKEGITPVAARLLKEIEQYKAIIPAMRFIKGDMFSDKHWMEMLDMLGIISKPVESLLFKDFLQAREKIVSSLDQLKDLNARAASEIVIRQALSELDVWEIEAKFTLFEHVDSQRRHVLLVQDYKDILNKIGDNQCLLQSIKSSPNFESFADQASIWEKRLATLDECLRNLTQIQRKWLYLEPIFGVGTLAHDKARFHRVDVDFRNIASDMARDRRVVSLCKKSGLSQLLNKLLDQLARCQKSLNDFLEEKRSAFPRFYFIGDDDLLEILGQSTKEKVVQAHLKKLFAGIHCVDFDKSGQRIIAMKSLDGEVVSLSRPITVTQNVEQWLSQLVEEMRSTLKKLLIQCLDETRRQGGPDPLSYPSQILCLAESIIFTERCESAINAGKLHPLLTSLKSQLESYTSQEIVSAGDCDVLELKLRALVLDTIHHMIMVEELLVCQSLNVDSWAWQKQLRFYIQNDGSAVARMVNAEFSYTYEYLGNAPKLVHTPLTDKCYLTLTQAMHMGLGGNPLGPAGTGKTESVKALGGLLGRQVLVFNCDEGIDVTSMARIFVGLVKCGAWGCFDEFNRLEEATLSAISMQIQPIQAALKGKHKSVKLLDTEVQLDPNAGIFVTMNPAGKGYGGRQQLPDNLKQLFRPVVMAQPDNEQIASVLLHTEGFQHAADLGAKLVEVFNLAKCLLSTQQHYDWGLRALKTVLRGCGSALRNVRKPGKSKLSAESEAELAVQALRLNTLSKLTSADCKRLDALLADIFPGIKLTESSDEKLVQALQASCRQLKLEENPKQIKKCLELYEQLQQRMGVVIVGPTGSGKTTLCKMLRHALSSQGQTVRQYTINPKAMLRSQLLGYVDQDTRQWQDGVLTISAQQVHAEPPEVTSWVLCDGDIDPEWVESLNSVLDDNRLLTLPSGWRIQFGPNVNFLFETHDLSQASPATISRMGMILLSEEDVNINHVVSVWLKQNSMVENIVQLIEEHFFKAVEWVQAHGEQIIPWSLIGLVRAGLSQMTGITSRSHFTCALIRGLSGNLSETTRQTFAEKVLEWTGEFIHDPSRVLSCYYDERRDCLDTYSTDELEIVPEGEGSRLVLTSNVKSILGHLEAWFQDDSKYPFLLVGPQGCGKSTILKYCFNHLRSTEVAEIHCSAQITPQHVLQKLSQVTMSISSNTGRVLRPKNTEHLILYFRDLNLAKPDKWVTSMLIAFLQQILTYGGFYDQSLEWVGIEGIQIIGSMTTSSSSGRHILSSRFTSLVAVHACSYPDSNTLRSIYGSLLYHTLAPTLPQFSQLKSSGKLLTLIDTMIRVYTEISTTFSPIQNNHYIFTPYFLTKWCQGLARYSFDGGRDLVESLLQAVVHECKRLFRDMLVSSEDCSKFDSILSSVIEEAWNRSISAILTRLSDSFYVSVGATGKKNNIYPHGKPLGPLNKNDWTSIVERTLAQYGREQQPLGLLIIPELLQGMAITERILSCPYGSLLLAGRAGAGRKSCIKLVATLLGARLFTLSMTSGYGIKHFKKDLKSAMQVAGVEMEQVYFLVEDHQLVEPNFLDMLNSLLSSGEVPGLYANDELEPLVSPLKDMAAQEGFSGSPAAFFAERVRQNLHLVLVMDCTDVNFIQNCESNPALYKHCAIQWWETWDTESMLKVPQLLLQKVEEGDDNLLENESVADQLISHLMTIHSEAPQFLLSPRRYVAFVHLYKHILSFKQKNIKERQGRLKAGVSKLTDARNVVAELRSQAELQEKQLAEKQEEAATALHLISETMQGANTQKSEMEILKDQTLKENEELLKRKKAIDVELAEIEPLVQEAQAAVGNIKTEALSEIRSLRAPPDVIRDILEGVLRLMGIQDTSWNSMKTFLAKRGVKEDIKSFNARNINSDNRHAVEKLLKDKRESFDPKNAKRASVAAAPLASWVTANVKYSVVLEKIRPLEREQNKLHKNLRAAEDHIGKLSTDLSDVNARVAELKERLNTYTKEAAEIEIHLTKAKDTLQAAETLVGKLNEEYERWRLQLTELSADLNDLPLQALLAAAFIAYLPGVPEEKRRALLTDWHQILGLQDFSLARFLASEQELLLWQSEGLPSDQVSIENAVVILQTGLRPLLVDPSSQACDWLKKHLHDRPVEVVAQSNERFTTLLELAVRFGKVLIIPEVDQISPILLPLLRGDFTSQGARCVVHIGEKLVDYHKDFQLFLVSRNLNPDISPTASSVISLVNFATTPAGLGAQLLSSALHHDKPELETRRGDLLREEERLRARLQQLQENLLLELAGAQGDVLQNKELLASLNETKASSAAIATSLSESSRLKEALGSERELYRPLSEFASRLFFATQDLSTTNITYQFSVATFCRLFQSSLHVTQAEETTEARISTVKRYLIRIVYDHVGRSLFKADRLMFAIHLVHKMYPELVPQNEWEVFTGQAIPDPSASKVPSWITEERSNAVRLLQSALPTLYASLQLSDERAWSTFAVNGECESHLPDHLTNMTKFQQVLVVQALRPDRLHSMLNIFAQKSLGLHDLSPSALSLKKLLSETQATEPILLLALSGTDPSEELRVMAVNTVGDQAFREVALGQGQVELAERLLQEASQNGQWLCLKNLHLVCKWIPVLESLLRSLQPHKNFRLWITSQPHPSLSPVLLQGCLKITYEAPQGIKRNLQKTYAGWGREMIETPGQQSVLRIQTLFALAWLHAILQERSTYVPQGWSREYEFSDSDLRSAAIILDPLVASGRIKWDYIYGLYECAIYGGRIDNTYDLRVLAVYLREYFNTSSLTGVKSFGPGITLPTSVKFTDSLNVISQLPDQDKPQLFGLPANIDRSWQRLTSQRVIHQLLVINRPEKGSIKFDLNKWESQLTPIFNLWKKLNQGSGLIQLKLPSEISKTADKPVQQFCALEWRSSVNLVQKVHRSLASLLRVVKGATLPNNEAIEIAEAIMQHQTPQTWLQIWEGPMDPLLFVRNVISRALAVQAWLQKSMQNQLLQENLNLSELFHPNTFLSALKQQTAREYNLAMSELHLVSSWSSVLPSARLSVRVCGLHIEGAKFTSGSLTEASPDSPSLEPLPTCILAWIPKREKSTSKSNIELPVYQTVTRKQLVTSLELACSGDKAKWMLASVALFLEI